jgi:hypothetical protein
MDTLSARVSGAVEGVRRRRPKMSREARKRIAEAQKKRWAAWKAKQGTAATRESALSEALTEGVSRKKR